ncbi:hypothetical protein FFA01_05170 [Frigoribacterium faeni]|uniref:Uncharacterized protein n=1 Tax=Frigoribacterium faeni TaxID=145483 RepID=A0ABQ0UL42_9MICO|nr:hypothetical protein GCM10025699_64380 [Microbacterium flavescens]GEK82208.1 hypothetical protein FFA01_05170 [Frigoribacterium faeni]
MAEKAEYDAVETSTPDATRASGTPMKAARRAARVAAMGMTVLLILTRTERHGDGGRRGASGEVAAPGRSGLVRTR